MAAPDYSRTKNALVGCLGFTALAFAGLFVTLQKRVAAVRPTHAAAPCIRATEAIQPLLVGDSVQLSLGVLDPASECGGEVPGGFTWSSSDRSIATIDEEGHVRAIAPGVFEATARRGDAVLHANGFVLPAGWAARITPDSQTVRVGDSFTVSLYAVDANGKRLPAVPFSIFTPEFFDPLAQKRPIVNRASWQNEMQPVSIVAVDTGTTMLIGRIGFQQVTSPLKILPAKTP